MEEGDKIVQDSQSMVDLQKRLKFLIEQGKRINGTSAQVDINKLPDFFDQQRFNQAKALVNKYFINIATASTAGLIYLLQIDSILVPLLKTGKSRTVCDLYDRYVATAKYIKVCYESDFYDSKSEGWKYLNLVRSMHQRIHKIMNNDFRDEVKGIIGDEEVWVNQHDMALTQFAFVGLFLIDPVRCGAFRVKKSELSLVTYYWRVLSYYFGIEEQFNIFVFHDSIDDQIEYMKMILSYMGETVGQDRIKLGVSMGEGFMLAFEDLAKDNTYNIFDRWWSPVLSLSGRKELQPYTWIEYWKLCNFYFYFKVAFRIAQPLMNWAYRRKFEKFSESGHKIKPKLQKKYGHLVYEATSPIVIIR